MQILFTITRKYVASYGLASSFGIGLLVALLLAAPAVRAQVPTWQMAIAATSTTKSDSFTRATATDASGNVYIAGVFTDTINFGAIALTAMGSDEDIFVAKWSTATNRFVWAQQAGGTARDFVTSLAVSGANVYVAGYSGSNSMDFGAIHLPGSSAGLVQGYLAKLADAGTTSRFAWAQQVGGPTGVVTAVAASGSNLYVAGNFTGTCSLGSNTLVSAGYSDAFVGKLVDAGASVSAVWGQQVSGASGEGASALAVSGANLYVAGNFASPVTSLGPIQISCTGAVDVFVAKLTDAGATGNFVWAKQAGGAGNETVAALATVGTNLYIAGGFQSTTTNFGSATLTNVGPALRWDSFVAKLTDAGSTSDFVWAQQAGGGGDDYAEALAIDGSNVYVLGTFQSDVARFGAIALTNNSTQNTEDQFAAKMTDTGSSSVYTAAQAAGGPGNDRGMTASIVNGTVYVGGYVAGTATFGSHTVSTFANARAASLASFASTTLSTRAAVNPTEALLSPNPAHTKVMVHLPAAPVAIAATLTLTNALGRTVLKTEVPLSAASQHYALDLAGLSGGFYVLRMQIGSTTVAQQLIIE